jgi:copper chaperone CopZ
MKQQIYIHHIPGRIRIRTEALKHKERTILAVQQLLQSMPGVLLAAVNPVTGSVTVTYETAQLHPAAILNVLRSHGYLKAQTKNPEVERRACERPVPDAPLLPKMFDETARRLGKMILGWMLERALSAAIAALI